jgi:L-fucose isomerase
MKEPRVGLITVSLAGERLDLAERFSSAARANLAKRRLEVLGGGLKLTGREVSEAARNARDDGADCIVYLVGTWISAPDVVTAMREVPLPTVIWGVPEPASFSSVGGNVLHGALDEIGMKHKLVYGEPDDEETLSDIAAFARAAKTARTLDGSRFGLIGGRSIGMYPSTVDPMQVKRVFGIEIEHVDQLALIEAARALTDEEVQPFYEQMSETFGKISVPEETMLRSIKVYFALKSMVEEREFAFVGVKCLEEVINSYVSCCLAIALANDDEIITACQSDINAAIAMKVMHSLTGQPAIFADVNMVDKRAGMARLINCGTMPTTLARRRKDVDWGYQYEYMGKARGACPTFCCKPGRVTFGAFSRIKGEYVMQIAGGEAYEQPKEVFAEVRDIWPHAFIRLDCDPSAFYQNLRSNHMVVGYGDIRQELVDLCGLLDVRPIALGPAKGT